MAVTVKSAGVIFQDAPMLVVVLTEDGRERGFTVPVAGITDNALRALCEDMVNAADAIRQEAGA